MLLGMRQKSNWNFDEVDFSASGCSAVKMALVKPGGHELRDYGCCCFVDG